MVDAIVRALWHTPATHEAPSGRWPQMTLEEIQAAAGISVGYEVPASTVRSSIYSHATLFQRVAAAKPVRYELSELARETTQ